MAAASARRDRADALTDPAATVPTMFAFLDGPELIVLLVVVVLIFGGSQLPKLARSLGLAQKEFKKGLDEGAKDDGTTPTKPS